ncbi:infection structure specific [Fusarium albosuccineum]|uniref:Infection structure specific n=1 Tax=Fusarium albosuccineum TaxID=1237068 RepID=A0A8H4LC89_9HYPO|nr:infection structure specific [Fusarium albosuccineum]
MQSKIVLVSLLASAVSASNVFIHPQMKRDLLQPRATDPAGGLSAECQSAIMDIYETVPTPAPEIVKDLTENPQTDPCNFKTPASLSKEYASYSSEIVSWYSKNEDGISSALEECPALKKYATAVPVCATDAGATAGGDKTTVAVATKTGDESADKTSDSDSESSDAASTPTSSDSPAQATNGAAREGGMIYAAAAVAGLVVAAL